MSFLANCQESCIADGAFSADLHETCGPWGPIKYIEILRAVLGIYLPSLESIPTAVADNIEFEVRNVRKMATSEIHSWVIYNVYITQVW